jgi:hypothetical protein
LKKIPTQQQMLDVINEQIRVIQAAAEEGYVGLGRGSVVIEFFYEGGWKMKVVYGTLSQLPDLGVPAGWLSDMDELIQMYEPDLEAAFFVHREGEDEGCGILDFNPKNSAN